MIDEAKKGLEWRKEFGRGGTEVGIRTARMIINNELTADRVTRMFSFHSRHQVDKEAEGYNSGEKGYPSNGRIAIALWGGDAGFSWSERKRKEIVEEEEKRVSAKIKIALENKRDEHNEDIKELSLDWDGSVTLPMLEKVFDRGVGAYHNNPQSVRPSVKSPEQWALARVNSFLYAMKKGKFRSGKHDTDLLPSKHPVKKEMEEKMNNMNIDCNDCFRNKRELVGTMITDGIELPLFSTKEEAEKMAEEMGGSGSHIHTLDGKEYFMPFDSHEQCMMMMSKDKDMEEEEIMEESYHYDKDEEEDEKTFRNNNPNVEKRTFNLESKIETREIDGKERNVVVGYGSVYNSRSENLGGFYEYISEGAFTDELINSSDVRALINHDPNLILARSKNGKGTLKLNADAKGLRYEFEMPDTSYARDLLINMKNNNLNQSSFAFTIPSGGDEWSSDDAGNNIRTINKIDKLFDISVVTYPAYSQADSDLMVAQRGLKEYKKTKKLVKHSLLGLKIEINKRK
jgi:HK97 family phage prohead protease